MSVNDWTPEERRLLRAETQDEQLARLIQKEAGRQKSRDYQARKRLAVIEKLGGKCTKCGEVDAAILQIDEHDKSLSWSPRYSAILDGLVRPALLCARCNWKKRSDRNEATGRPRNSF
jgi:5-methylcytosine-specific restriction endonuclease McrA